MKTICMVGYGLDGTVADLLRDAGYFVMMAPTADIALATLNVVRADAFVISMRDPAAAGEHLIERLGEKAPWRQLPIVMTWANQAQLARWTQRATVGEVIPADEAGDDTADGASAHAALVAVRRLLARGGAAAFDDVPGRHAWGDEVPVLPSTLDRWIPPHAPIEHR